MTSKYRVVGINFDHFHMGDLLRMAKNHPQVELVGVHDEQPKRVHPVLSGLELPPSLLWEDCERMLDATQPDIVVLCPAAAKHAEWVARVARKGQLLLIEKPFAGSLSEARRMMAIADQRGCQLAINWPLAWVATHRTAYEYANYQQAIGELVGVNYYGGNRGPLWHTFDKIEITAEEVAANKPTSWFYQKASGGGSLLDYLGYGATLGSWYLNNRQPLEVTTVVDQPAGLEVDEHSITICRYAFGLSRMETRWGTFTDPWNNPTIPPTGYTLFGTEGVIQSSDYASCIRMQNREHPDGIDVPSLAKYDPSMPRDQREACNPIEYVVDCLDRKTDIDGPLGMAINLTGQRLIDTAMMSAQQRRTVLLLD